MNNDDKDSILERFDVICQNLQIDDRIWQRAIKTIETLNIDGGLSTDFNEWICCSIYSELQHTKLRDMRQDPDSSTSDKQEQCDKRSCGNSWNISLTKLLRSFNINIKKFLTKMGHWNWLAQNSNVFQLEIGDLERRLGITLLLLEHYKRIFKQLYKMPASAESRSHYHMILDFGWLLFLVVRNELPAFATTNLVNGCQVLICALELVYVNALEVKKSDVINTQFNGVPTNWCGHDYDMDKLLKYSALDAICTLLPELPSKGARIMKNAFFHKAVMGLFMDQRLLGNDRAMRELIKDGILEVNLASLNRSYAAHVSDISEMDERVLLHHNLKMFDSHSGLGTTQRRNLTKLLSQELPQTLPAYISNTLGNRFGVQLDDSLHEMCRKFETFTNLNEESIEIRFRLVKGLYHVLLDKIVGAELLRRPKIKIAHLLLDLQRSFNTTLIVCCLEIVWHIYASTDVDTSYPRLLSYFKIDAYEFLKIIELVVRHESGLFTQDLIKHLLAIETQCLLSLIWVKNSRLWRVCDGMAFPNCQQVQFGSEQENVGHVLGSTVFCLRKFYHLAHQRLVNLCRSLSLLKWFTQVWHVTEHSIVVHGATLLQQRHLDQLLMCAVYLCVRRADLRITFSQIIQQYRRQPFAQSCIYRAVHMPDGESDSDIITFYNRVYVRLMADYAHSSLCDQSSDLNKKSAVKRPLQEFSSNGQLQSNGHNASIFVSSEAMPGICMESHCKANTVAVTKLNLKRAHSNDELRKSSTSKRPNILKRRTSWR